jgi:serine/threonine protein kinase
MGDEDRLSFEREVEILSTLSHPYIEQFIGAYEDDVKCYLALELVCALCLYGASVSICARTSVTRQGQQSYASSFIFVTY